MSCAGVPPGVTAICEFIEAILKNIKNPKRILP
jgi:hypothetical protein